MGRLIVVLLGYFLLAQNTLANTVVIYVIDSKSMLEKLHDVDKPLNQNELKGTLKLINSYSKENSKQTFTVVLSEDEAKGLTEDSLKSALVKTGWEVGLKIDRLVLAAHGATKDSSNKTIFSYMGGFDATGPFGGFKVLIDFFKLHFAEDVHILLKSCSTLCGSAGDTKKRILGLFDYIFKDSHVNNLSLWGANMNLRVLNDNGTPVIEIESLTNQKAKKYYFFTYPLVFTTLMTVVSAPILFVLGPLNQTEFTINSLFENVILNSIGLSYVFSSINFRSMHRSLKNSGYKGYFTRTTPGKGIQLIKSDYFSQEAHTGMVDQCDFFLR